MSPSGRSNSPFVGKALAALAAATVGLFSIPLLVVFGLAGSSGGSQPSARAVADIPPGMISLYQQAVTECPGLSWTVLAAIGKVESNHSRSNLPGVHSGTNYAGAAGPMQFLAGTWAQYGRDGDQDGDRDIYDPVDAIPAAAAYLCASGAGDPERLGVLVGPVRPVPDADRDRHTRERRRDQLLEVHRQRLRRQAGARPGCPAAPQ